MKKEEKTESTKKRIIELAMIEFGSEGYAGATVNHICEAGISKGLIYHNFKNKDELYLVCVEKSYKKLIEYIQNANVESDLDRYMKVRMDFFKNNREEARIFFETLLQPPVDLNNEITNIKSEYQKMNEAIIINLISQLALRAGVSQQSAVEYFTLMQNMFNGYFSSPAFTNFSMDEKINVHESNLNSILDFIIYGIVAKER